MKHFSSFVHSLHEVKKLSPNTRFPSRGSLMDAAQDVIDAQSKDDSDFWKSESAAMSPGLLQLKHALSGTDADVEEATINLANEIYAEGNYTDPALFVADVLSKEPELGRLFKFIYSDFADQIHEGFGKKVDDRYKPITSHKGSWADEEAKKKENLKEDSDSGMHPIQRFAHEMGLDTRSASYGFSGVRCLAISCNVRELAQLFYNIGEAKVLMSGSRSVPKFVTKNDELVYFPDIRFVDEDEN